MVGPRTAYDRWGRPVDGEDAILAALEPHLRALVRTRFRWVGHALGCDLDDVLQVARLGALRGIRTWCGTGNRGGWCLYLASYAVQDMLRPLRKGRVPHAILSDVEEAVDPPAPDDRDATIDRMDAREALGRLRNRRIRRILYMRHVLGLQQQETARRLGVTPSRLSQIEADWRATQRPVPPTRPA